MTHMRKMEDHEGTFGPEEPKKYVCRRCGVKAATCRVWESSCGGYEDNRYDCGTCGYAWWVDGPDA